MQADARGSGEGGRRENREEGREDRVVGRGRGGGGRERRRGMEKRTEGRETMHLFYDANVWFWIERRRRRRRKER